MIMGLINMVPKWAYAAAVAALLALAAGLGIYAGSLKLEVGKVNTEFAQYQTQVANQERERERVAREHAERVAKEQFRHAEIQQENVHAFRAQEAADRARDQRLRSELDQLRDDVAAYAAGRGAAGETDPNTCRSERDRSERLGAALGEALQLQGEAEAFIRQRDREVKLLKEVIGNDRNLTTKEPQ